MAKRLLFSVAALLVGLSLAAAGLYGLRETLVGPRLLAAVNQRLAPVLGFELRAERIGGNYFNQLAITGLRSVTVNQAGALTESSGAPESHRPDAAAPAATPGATPSAAPGAAPANTSPTASATTSGPASPAAARPWQLELEIARLRLDYSLPALLRGLEPFLATVKVRVEEGQLTGELTAAPPSDSPSPSALAAAWAALDSPELAPALHRILSQVGQVTTRLPAISGRNLNLRLQGPDFAVAAIEVALDYLPPTATNFSEPAGAGTPIAVQPAGSDASTSVESSDQRPQNMANADPLTNQARFQLQSSRFSLSHSQLIPQQAPLALELSLDPGPRAQTLNLAYLHWGKLLRLNSGVLTTDPTNLRLELPLQILGDDLRLQADLGPNQRELSATLAPFALARLEQILVNPPPLSGRFSGRLQLQTDPEGEGAAAGAPDLIGLGAGLRGNLEMALQEATLAGRELDDLTLQATLAQGQLLLAELALRLGTNRLLVEDLALPLAAIPLTKRADSQTAVTGQQIQPTADRSPAEQLGANLLRRGRIGHLSADFADIPALFAAAGFALPAADDSPLPEHRLLLTAGLDQGRLSLRELSLESSAGRLELPTAEIGPWPASANLGELPFSGQLQLDITDLADLARLLRPTAPIQPTGRLQADLKLRGTPAAPTGQLALTGENLGWGEFKLEKIRLNFADQSAPALAATAADPASKLQLEASGLGHPEFQLARLAAEIQASGTPTAPRLAGRLSLAGLSLSDPEPKRPLPELSAIAADFSWQSGRLALPSLSLSREADRLQAGFNLLLPAAANRPDQPWSPFFQLYQELSALSPATTVLTELEAHLTVAELAAYAALFPADSNPAGALTLELSGGGSPTGHDLQADLQLTAARWAETTLEQLAGQLAFRVSVLDPPVADAEQRLVLRLPGATLTALAGEGNFSLHGLSHGKTTIDRGRGQFRLAQGGLTFSGVEVSSGAGNLQLAGTIFGLLEPAPALYRLELDQLELKHQQLQLSLARPARLAWGDGRLQVADFELSGHGAMLSLGGDYTPADPATELNLQGRLQSDELAWLATFIPGVRRLEGRLAADFQLRGPTTNPQLSGNLSFEQGELRLEGDTPALRELRLTASFARNGLEISDLGGLWGGAPFKIRGRIELPPGFPLELRPATLTEETIFHLALSGEDILFYRAEGILVRGQGELAISGPLARLRIDGQVAIHDGRYTRNLDFFQAFRAPGGGARRQSGLGLFSLTSPPWRDLSFNIRLRATQPFVVANNMARGSLRPELHLGGSGELPVLTGEIYFNPTRITMPAGRLEIGSGLIRFPVQNPDRPEFDLLASTRMAGYDISLILQGTAAEPVLTLSSTPPLADDQLLVLLLTGQLPAAFGEEGARRRAGMNVAVFLGRDLLGRIFHRDEPPSDEALLERISLEVGRSITRSGDETIEAELWLTDDFFQPGDRIYLTSEKDVYDDFNLGLKIVFRFR